MNIWHQILNALLYQGAWFACVLGAAQGRAGLGIATASAVIAIHLLLAKQAKPEVGLILIAVLTGTVFESLLVMSGWISMPAETLWANITPLWMVALWAAFATTLNVAMRALRQRYLLVALIAAVGAPLAYLAGAKLGALQWINAPFALAMIAVGWGVLMPLLMRSAQHFDGFRQT